jgi:acyl dehydratase
MWRRRLPKNPPGQRHHSERVDWLAGKPTEKEIMEQSNTSEAAALLYFEDFKPGTVFDLGHRTLAKEDIIAFATEYDPQPFHVDEEVARESAFGGLIASGWHTGSVFMRLYADALLSRAAAMGSPGVEELRWLKPVRPGDTLTARVTVLDTTLSTRNPKRGTVHLFSEVENQHGETVMTMRARGLFARREEGETPNPRT